MYEIICRGCFLFLHVHSSHSSLLDLSLESFSETLDSLTSVWLKCRRSRLQEVSKLLPDVSHSSIYFLVDVERRLSHKARQSLGRRDESPSESLFPLRSCRRSDPGSCLSRSDRKHPPCYVSANRNSTSACFRILIKLRAKARDVAPDGLFFWADAPK